MRWLRWILSLGRFGIPVRVYDGTVSVWAVNSGEVTAAGWWGGTASVYGCIAGSVDMASWYSGSASVDKQFTGTVGTLT
jgi:hypothetical protein